MEERSDSDSDNDFEEIDCDCENSVDSFDFISEEGRKTEAMGGSLLYILPPLHIKFCGGTIPNIFFCVS